MDTLSLLALINEVKQPDEILTKLKEKQFAITDVTDDGDSILHVLAKSDHAKKIDFSDYLNVLITAGANVNAVDRQGNGFLGYFIERTRTGMADYYKHKTFKLLLRNDEFDVNQRLTNGFSLFEFFFCSKGYQSCDHLKTLIAHDKFNPNQKTSEHNAVLLHMVFKDLFQYREQLVDVINHKKTDPNVKNDIGKTALALILEGTQSSNMEYVNALVNNELFDINALDNDGNNYLQLAIISQKFKAEQIALLLINRGIDVTHKNKEGKSVFDLLFENKAGRSNSIRNDLMLTILKAHPSSLYDKCSDGRTILAALFVMDDWSIRSKFVNIIELCKKQEGSAGLLKKIIEEAFASFHQNGVSEETMLDLIQALVTTGISVDVEYCLALVAICNPQYKSEKINSYFKRLKPDLDFNVVIGHIKNLTQEGSNERSKALSYICKFNFTFNNINDFSDSTLAFEAHHLQTKIISPISKDTAMFGHLFALSGSIPVDNSLVRLTGSNSFYTAPFIVHLMNTYLSHCEQNNKYTEHQDAIRQVRNMTIKAMRYYFMANYSGTLPYTDDYLSSMEEDSKQSGVELFTGWPEHGIDIIIKQKDLYRNNGGGCSTDTTTEHYKITKPENVTKQVFASLFVDTYESNKTYIQQNLHETLGLVYHDRIDGEFQTVGNCDLHNKLIALKIKYRLFLPESIADELFIDTIQFFEQFFLKEYLSLYANNSALPHLLMRLITQKLLPEGKLDLIRTLLTDHFSSESNQEILQTELMLKGWLLEITGQSRKEFDKQLQFLEIKLFPEMNTRLQVLDHFLNDKVTHEDLDELKSWSLTEQQFQGYHLLHLAVMNNNLELASTLIQMFPNAVDQPNWHNQEPLCLVQSVEMIDLLVKTGADTAKTKNDNALDCAIRANRVDLVRALLNHGAKPSEYSAYYAASKDPKILNSLMEFHPEAMKKTTHSYRTPVHAAALAGQNENIQSLVYYADVNTAAKDVNGVTPLQLALQNERTDTVRLLLQYPGTLFKRPYRGDSVVKMAKDTEMQQLLMHEKHQRKADRKYFKAFKNSNPGIVKENIDYLIIAIRTNDVRAIRGFLFTYPDVKVVKTSNHYFTTPLTEAIQKLAGKKGEEYDEAFNIVKMLLKTPGIDINACTATSEPILFWATSIGDVAVLELFLADPKLNPNQQDNIGYTALHDAVERGHLSCVKRLLQDKRVDSSIVNKRGETAADLVSFRRGVGECVEEVVKSLSEKSRFYIH
ncbi:ankyrin repeat domain-containing protein [Legionella sp. PATHC038]|uniref:ankyrin repeat domain-containing protein n=1 Tax=Legionella sheltonii TaxID=2992041 RepID=UPI002243F99D|nr:ankyrin repeat domain-containing protein [Legionella sp. PATHC038]MCW8400033.1 ankyrin repeat domain-containing protein [Legionella sp. PATHC038]